MAPPFISVHDPYPARLENPMAYTGDIIWLYLKQSGAIAIDELFAIQPTLTTMVSGFFRSVN